MPTCLLC